MNEYSIIPALRNIRDIELIKTSPAKNVFLMVGEILTLGDTVKILGEYGKSVYIHTDLIKGISNEKETMAYIANKIQPAGIVTTKPQSIKHARANGLKAILHLFLIDTAAYETGLKNIKEVRPDGVEIMPGLMPEIIAAFKSRINIPVYAGGLVKTREQVAKLMAVGVSGVITGELKLWK